MAAAGKVAEPLADLVGGAVVAGSRSSDVHAAGNGGGDVATALASLCGSAQSDDGDDSKNDLHNSR